MKSARVVLGLLLVMSFVAYLPGGEDVTHAASSPAARLPSTRILGTLSDRYEPVTFDHAKHASLAAQCGVCHHHANGAETTCQQCHNINPSVFKNSVVNNFMPCSSCHGAPDPGNPAMPGLKVAYHKKCFGCHRGMGDIGVDPRGCTELCHAKKESKSANPARP